MEELEEEELVVISGSCSALGSGRRRGRKGGALPATMQPTLPCYTHTYTTTPCFQHTVNSMPTKACLLHPSLLLFYSSNNNAVTCLSSLNIFIHHPSVYLYAICIYLIPSI